MNAKEIRENELRKENAIRKEKENENKSKIEKENEKPAVVENEKQSAAKAEYLRKVSDAQTEYQKKMVSADTTSNGAASDADLLALEHSNSHFEQIPSDKNLSSDNTLSEDDSTLGITDAILDRVNSVPQVVVILKRLIRSNNHGLYRRRKNSDFPVPTNK